MLTETTWIVLIIWMVLFIISLRLKDPLFRGIAGVIGTFFGLTMIREIPWFGFTLLMLNIYLLYRAFFGGGIK